MSVHCAYHCATCGCHFKSLEAFDLHRAGDHAVKRFCLDPDVVDRLAVGSADGVCKLGCPGQVLRGVVVYVSRRHLEDHQGVVLRLRGAERQPEGAEGDLDLRSAA